MIAVTGAAGFIGSALIDELNRRGITDILAVDKLGSDDRWKNLNGLKFTDYEEKDSFLKRVVFQDPLLKQQLTGIIHMGACSSTTETDASYLIENNYKYSMVLAKWCLRENKRFVYASSAATYGDGTAGFDDNHDGIDALRPLNMYGYSKQLFDMWALRANLLDKIAGMKFFNVYGPNEYHKGDMRSLIHKAYGQIQQTGRLKLFKSYRDGYRDGEQKRDFIYIKDAVNMTLHVYDKGLNGIFNAGTGEARSWNSLAEAVFRAMDLPVKIDYIEMPEAIRDKYQYFTRAKMDKLFANYTAKLHTLEDGINDYVRNYIAKDGARLQG
ncbi:MAG: ADP-glyceromanno-heptose 6-epimerase [Spirochaetia bacterium]|nr:ADP-glyceromanno-heptose 6-epimerase [Spirochaetia bacterium]